MSSSRRAKPAWRHWGAGDVGDLDDRQLIIDALGRLSATDRAMICRACSGWTTAQIAADLQVADSLVKATLHNAVRALDSNVSVARAQRAQHV